MDNVSVSKGVFANKGRYKIGNKTKTFRPPDYFDKPWFLSYDKTWKVIQQATEKIRSNMFQQILIGLKSFVSKVNDASIDICENEIPTAILLTGVNLPDHAVLFQTIITELEPLTKHTALLSSRDCTNIKSILEETIYQLINNNRTTKRSEIKRSQCTMRNLKLWYQEYCDKNDPLVLIITDFESSSASALHDFILILSSYSNKIKFVLIFGIATTLHAVHRSLSYDVTSKLNVQVFHMQTQINVLSDVLNSTVFASEIPFKLTGRAFQLLTDIFLFYDFSVESFLQSYKMCMIQHFYASNVNSLCCQLQDIDQRISELTEEDAEEIKKIPSIDLYLKKLTKSDDKKVEIGFEQFKVVLKKLLIEFQQYMNIFLTALKCLHRLTSSLPNSPMGKQLREYYTKAVYVNNLTESQEYKECLQLLGFLSKRELLSSLEAVLEIVTASKVPGMETFRKNLQNHISTIQEASLEVQVVSSNILTADEKLSRAQLKEKLLKMSQKQSRSPYKQAQIDLIKFLDEEIFSLYLVNPSRMTANEIFCFGDGNLAKQHIRGSLRAAIHTGLSDPHMYLNCECCKLENDDAIPSSLPDLSIIYKLHLESRKLINMYDWLQAFLIIVDPESGEAGEQRNVNPKLQARFTQAVAELEFLGFIKTSRKKTDHVKRLT